MRALALLLAVVLAAPGLAQKRIWVGKLRTRACEDLDRIIDEGTVQERLHLAVSLLRENERRMLAPTPGQRDSVSALLRQSDTGITCLAKGEDLLDQTIVENSGAYFSFEHESHANCYLEYDLRLDWGFDADFYGGRIGMILPIGDVALLDLPTEREPVPDLLDRAAQDGWLTLWEHLDEEDVAHGSQFREHVEHLLEPAVPQADTTYLLRLCQPGGANRLVAFRVLGENRHRAVTIAWRVLHRWKRTTLIEPPRPGPWDDVPPAPDWLWEWFEDVDQPVIEGALSRLRLESARHLFGVPDELRARYDELISSQVETFGTRFPSATSPCSMSARAARCCTSSSGDTAGDSRPRSPSIPAATFGAATATHCCWTWAT